MHTCTVNTVCVLRVWILSAFLTALDPHVLPLALFSSKHENVLTNHPIYQAAYELCGDL